MEISVSGTNLSIPRRLISSPLFFHYQVNAHPSAVMNFNNLPRKLQCVRIQTMKARNLVAASGAQSTATDDAERWILEPVGDGDSRHIGLKVSMPGAYEIASDMVTVGRVPEKADIVIPVATVSALHARIQKKNGRLLVTDLDSTNGTFIDENRLKPGVAATISPGSCITFGDANLAIFRVSKLQNVEAEAEAEAYGTSEESEAKAKPDSEEDPK